MSLNFSPSFMEIYDNSLTKSECELLISQFEKSHTREGTLFKDGELIIDHNYKKSVELFDCLFSKSTIVSSIISTSLNKCFDRYRKKYSILDDNMSPLKYDDLYTFKKFEGEDAGFKTWHYEHGPNDTMSKRVLVWAFYLNDAPGTDFIFYPNVSGKEGRCVIFPASFNYMHRSSPNKGIKYIVTGWFSYA